MGLELVKSLGDDGQLAVSSNLNHTLLEISGVRDDGAAEVHHLNFPKP
jgi:hypothetical protein